MDKKNIFEIFDSIKEEQGPEFFLQYRIYSTLASIVEGNVTIKEIAESISQRTKGTLPGLELDTEDIIQQLTNDHILQLIEDAELICVKNNQYACKGLGLLIGYMHYLFLKEHTIETEQLLQLLSGMVTNLFHTELLPDSLFSKKELVTLFEYFKGNFEAALTGVIH